VPGEPHANEKHPAQPLYPYERSYVINDNDPSREDNHRPPTRNRVMETVNVLVAVVLAAQFPNVTTGLLIAAISLCAVIVKQPT
jgi:hypothetical protein